MIRYNIVGDVSVVLQRGIRSRSSIVGDETRVTQEYNVYHSFARCWFFHEGENRLLLL